MQRSVAFHWDDFHDTQNQPVSSWTSTIPNSIHLGHRMWQMRAKLHLRH